MTCRTERSSLWGKTAVLLVVLAISGTAWGKIIYVDADAEGANNGLNWTDAFTDLQDALGADGAEEIRVAQGVYTPAEPFSSDRTASFVIPDDVPIRGGYAGFGEPDPNARDITLYETILSGDLNGDDVEVADVCNLLTEPTRSENNYTVVYCGGGEAALLDGFTITGGNANAPGPYDPDLPYYTSGGGLCCDGMATISNCTIKANSAVMGGGIYIAGYSYPTIGSNTIKGNAAGQDGGGICFYSEQPYYLPTISGNLIKDNTAKKDGGGIHCRSSQFPAIPLTINGNTIMGNVADDSG